MPSPIVDKNGNPLTSKDGNPIVFNKNGNGILTNSTNDEVTLTVPSYLKIPVSAPFSVALTLCHIGASANDGILSTKDVTTNGLTLGFANTSSDADVYINFGAGTGNRLIKTFTGALPRGFSALVFTKSNLNTLAAAKCYVRGVEATSSTGSSNLTTITYSATHILRIANDITAAGRYWGAYFFDVKIFLKELSQAEVTQHFRSDGKYLPDSSWFKTLTGAITTTAGSTAVTASGGAFLTECKVGEALFNSANSYIGNIASITNNNSLTLMNNALVSVAGGTVKHGSYVLGWSFEEKSGTSVADNSGFGNTGTIVGSSSTSLGASNMHRDGITYQPIVS